MVGSFHDPHDLSPPMAGSFHNYLAIVSWKNVNNIFCEEKYNQNSLPFNLFPNLNSRAGVKIFG
jgi:hypothetical protein